MGREWDWTDALLISFTIIIAVAAVIFIPVDAAVIHLNQRDVVYYNDTVDLRTVVGWTENISWWSVTSDPSTDEPDHIITIKNFTAYKITKSMEMGYWFQWYGENERSPVVAFIVSGGKRPNQTTTKPVPTQQMTVTAINQPAPIADILVARWDTLEYPLEKPCQVWLVGPSGGIMGKFYADDLVIDPVELAAGEYKLFLQYPDGNGVYEIFYDGGINSTWKDVRSIETDPLAYPLVIDALREQFADREHFHGNVTELRFIVQDQIADITSMDANKIGELYISGVTNLGKGDQVKIIFDDDKTPLESDKSKNTVYANVTGDDPGAMRIWRGTMKVNLNSQPVGDHFIGAYTPDGRKTQVSFYIGERFFPFDVPEAHIKYVNTSPFLPTPTPEVITIHEVVTKTLVEYRDRTIYVNVTPDYATIIKGDIAAIGAIVTEVGLYVIIPAVLLYAVYAGSRMWVKKKEAKSKKAYKDFFDEF